MHFFSLLCQLKLLYSVSPDLPFLQHLRPSTELATYQYWELLNLKVTLQRSKPQGCQKKLPSSYTSRSLTLDKSDRWDASFKYRVYPFWHKLSKQNISKTWVVYFISLIVQMSCNSRDSVYSWKTLHPRSLLPNVSYRAQLPSSEVPLPSFTNA